MQKTEKMILWLIEKMSEYYAKGGMTAEEIADILDEIRLWYIRENEMRIMSLLEDSGKYENEEDKIFYNNISSNVEAAASLLGCSKATVYRKLRNHSFTLVEKETLKDELVTDSQSMI